jgi:hypothetical protein
VGMDIRIHEENYLSEWASLFPPFANPKKNGNGTIRIFTDFMKLNLLLKRRLSPISYPKDRES